MPQAEFFLAVCDSLGKDETLGVDFPLIGLGDLGDDRIYEMAERYNITEFCTAIKPWVFRTLYARNPGATVSYIDPDILAMSPFDEVFARIDEGANLVLTPHVLEPSRHEVAPDRTMLKFGCYNLGFLATRANDETDALMAWWCDRLEHECVIDLPEGIFVDQKWADLFPSLIDRVSVLRHPGYNVAYWNLLQRTVTFDGETWSCNGEDLRFVHFSGNEMTKPGVFSRHGWYIDYSGIGDLKLLYERYRELVAAAGYFEKATARYAFNFSGAAGVNLHTPDNTADVLARGGADVFVPLPSFLPGTQGARADAATPLLQTKAIASWEEFAGWKVKSAKSEATRRRIEVEAEGDQPEWFDVQGVCGMCRNATPMRVSYMYAHAGSDGRMVPNWREHLDCRCGFINRIRAAMHLLRTTIRPAPEADMYISERVTQLFKWLKLRHPRLVGSEYMGSEHEAGALVRGIRHEDLCGLSFGDSSFDVMMSFDVLEHVEHFDRALYELFRCLRPGGTLLFAAPTQLERPEVIDRVLVGEDGTYEYLAEPEYHGNPVDAEKGALCFRYLGLDVLEVLRAIGFREAKAIFYWSRDFGYLGQDQLMFLARK
jgi:SAM-dependent methyltransferase